MKRYTGNLRGNFDISPKLQIGLLATSAVRKQLSPGTSDQVSDASAGNYSRSFEINPYSYALRTSRATSIYEEDGSLTYYTDNYAPFNILNEIKNNTLNTDMLDFKLQGELRYKITKDLKFSFDGAYRFATTKQEQIVTEESNMVQAFRSDYSFYVRNNNPLLFTDPDDPLEIPTSILPQGGFYLQSNTALSNYYLRNSLDWNKQVGKHLFDVFASAELRYIARQSSDFNGVGYQYDRGGTVAFDPQYFKYLAVNGGKYYSMSESNDRYLAYMAKAAYAYDDKYVLNATMRYDGSNMLGKSRLARWLPTWNVSGAWNIDREAFFANQNILSQARARLTYGLVASISSATNSAVVFKNGITSRPILADNENTIRIDRLENSNLTWEKQYETNLGFDLGFLKNKINLTVELYDRRGFDLLGNIKTSGIGGLVTKYANYADMKSKGIEFTLAGTPVNNDNFKWRMQLNGAFHKSKITNLQSLPTIWSLVTGGMLVDYPPNALFSMKFDGLDELEGYPYFVDDLGNHRATEVNTSSTSIGNLVYHGPSDPPFTGGFYNSFTYKQFTLSAMVTFSAGNFVRLNPTFQARYSDLNATSKAMLNRWVMPGDELKTTTPSVLGWIDFDGIDGSPYNNYNYSSVRVAKGDFIRLKQVMLTYQLPGKFAKHFWAKSANVSLVTNNIWLIYADSKLNGQDPEFAQSGGVAMPQPKQTSISFKFNF
ncbi:TonB-dependent receptor [Pedobacter agri]|uniref:TonB-dependent receptor n=1 Tax=Pedobacter agri TaxID=454586 RepID=UPI00292F85A5|nr:TonB-dependent receptor [Pedobacter agri]